MGDEVLTVSQIIDKLTSIKETYGDILVGTWNDGILKFIRSVKHIKADTGLQACVLQWWEEE